MPFLKGKPCLHNIVARLNNLTSSSESRLSVFGWAAYKDCGVTYETIRAENTLANVIMNM